MAVQRRIEGTLTRSIVGEFSDRSVKSARSYICYGNSDEEPTIGRVMSFVEKTATDKFGVPVTFTAAKMEVGSESTVCGILVEPKEHVIQGFKTGRTIHDGTVADVAVVGHISVFAKTSVVAGGVVYVDAVGNLGDETLDNAIGTLLGAHWLRTADIADGESEVMTEISIDHPSFLSAEEDGGPSTQSEDDGEDVDNPPPLSSSEDTANETPESDGEVEPSDGADSDVTDEGDASPETGDADSEAEEE